ncbi:aquaporin-9 [Opisthocomus hoazin]|uniref:aquaporin-9 n=1 Tax=Opisthocomus hoazin TaxID=30419 RepID=UPI000522C1E5|nr:PREDICTED: aquaporin-9 [Opisthocomus hoazin]
MSRKSRRSLKEKLALKNSWAKEALSEFLGTFVLVVLGCGSTAQAVLSRGASGDIVSIVVGTAMGIVIAVYTGAGVSGGHVNPAVSLAMSVTGRLKWRKLPVYLLAQLLGGFVGAAAVFGVYHDALMAYNGGALEVTGPNATAHIFATYPSPFLSLASGFADQVLATALLLLGIFAIVDTRNNGTPKGLEPIAIGLLVTSLAFSLALNSGGVMNPARDLGPRLLTAIAGWGTEVFTAGNNWWWVPIVAPLLGGVLGAVIYVVFIEMHHSETQPQENVVCDKYQLTNVE